MVGTSRFERLNSERPDLQSGRFNHSPTCPLKLLKWNHMRNFVEVSIESSSVTSPVRTSEPTRTVMGHTDYCYGATSPENTLADRVELESTTFRLTVGRSNQLS